MTGTISNNRLEPERLLRDLTANPDATFHSGQLEAIEAVTKSGGRALVVQRTGWGKSAVYFIATKTLRAGGAGPTVIVSPLLALMRNQIEAASRLGLTAETVNSSNRDDWDEVFTAIDDDEIDLLLISPERLNNPQFRRDILPELLNRLGLLVIDEAHCISDWGHDFRPDYRRLQRIVEAMPPSTPVLGTTATANDRVVDDIEEQLGSNLAVIRGTLDRPSLRLQVIDMPDKADRMAWLAKTIPELPGAGIVKVRQRIASTSKIVSRGTSSRWSSPPQLLQWDTTTPTSSLSSTSRSPVRRSRTTSRWDEQAEQLTRRSVWRSPGARTSASRITLSRRPFPPRR